MPDNPNEEDVNQFCENLRVQLDKDCLAVYGVTTDGSPLYTHVIPRNLPQARHQICEFHILKELNELILWALTDYRRALKFQMGEKHPCSRPKNSKRHWVAQQKKQRRYIRALFKSRGLGVKQRLTPWEKKVLKKLSRGHPYLRALRELEHIRKLVWGGRTDKMMGNGRREKDKVKW